MMTTGDKVNTPRRRALEGDWTLAFTDPRTGARRSIKASVPGNVELDLIREGLLDDPWPADDPWALRDFERVDDWTYETRFDAPALGSGETARLVFEGIDTIADVTLNGQRLMRCENMLIPHAADVTAQLKPKDNQLSVRIYSSELHARRFPYPAGQVSRPPRQASAYLRKAAHQWGWDNAPRLVSAGIWRPVFLEILPPIRWSQVYVYTQRVTPESVWIGCDWRFETPDADLGGYRGRMTLSSNGQVEHEMEFDIYFIAGKASWRLPADQVRLWWPRGFGEPHLYDFTLQLVRNGQIVAEETERLGIRELDLIHTETTNAAGDGEFVFVCNGEKIYINGTNWKPLDALHSRAAGKVRRSLELALDLNCAMIRIWGGGVYEDHDFFDFCDEHGVMVWQDFMFACGLPPSDEAFQRAVAHEAATIVQRLRNHPSLAVWCGDNEVDATFLWGTFVPKHLLPSDNVINRQILKNAVKQHDPHRGYIESSPFISDLIAKDRWRADAARGDLASPETHLYPGNEQFRDAFRRCASHFIGETGPFFINAMSQTPWIIERELARARRLWDAPLAHEYTLDRHQTDDYFLTWKDATRKRLQHLFGRDFPLEPWQDLALAANILCGEIFKFAIEYSRSKKWRKTGVLWWSLLDMWPMGFNYSVVDYDFRPKQPAYDWIRQSQQPLCLMAVAPESGDPQLFVANDTLQPWQGDYRIKSVDAHGAEVELAQGTFAIDKNQNLRLQSVTPRATPALWLIEWRAGGTTGHNHFVCGQPPYDFEGYRRWVERVASQGAGAASD